MPTWLPPIITFLLGFGTKWLTDWAQIGAPLNVSERRAKRYGVSSFLSDGVRFSASRCLHCRKQRPTLAGPRAGSAIWTRWQSEPLYVAV